VVEGSVSIADDGEILVGVPHRQAIGYFGVDPAEEALTFLPDGRVATGDLGRFDRQGYLFITGRKKDLIITQSGQKIHPETLERDLSAIRGVVRAVVIGGGDVPGLVAIVAVDPNSTTEHEAQVQAEVQSTIELLNKRMPAASRIGRSIITRKPFRPETGLLTRNLKLDRRAVQRYFERDIMQGASQASEARPS
jgi:long-subunit acyl-CoA synthetase (AMP-forming)